MYDAISSNVNNPWSVGAINEGLQICSGGTGDNSVADVRAIAWNGERSLFCLALLISFLLQLIIDASTG